MRHKLKSHSVLNSVRGDGRGWVLLSLALGWLLVLGVRFLIPAILPQIKSEFHISDGVAGIAITVIWGCYAISQFPAGILTDRLGARILLTTSLIFTALALTVFVLSPVFTAFLLGCAVFGLATGLYGPTRGVALSRTFENGRNTAFGVTLAAGSIGSAVFPVLATSLIVHVDWRITVAAIVPLALMISVGLWHTMPEHKATNEVSTQELLPARTVAATLNDYRILAAGVGIMLMLFSYQGLTAFLPIYLIESKGLSQLSASTLFAFLFLFGAGFQFLSGKATDAYSSKAVLVAIAAIGTITLAVLPYTTGFIPLSIIVALLSTRLVITPVNNSYILSLIPTAVEGTTWGIIRTCYFLIASTGSTFVGVMSSHGRLDTAFFILSGVTAVAFVCYLSLPSD